MRFSSILVGAAMLLSSVSVAQAQTDLDSKVTIALVRHLTTASGNNSSDVKTRLNTKDLLALVEDVNTTGSPKTIMFRRDAVAAATDPTAINFLDGDPVLLDADGTTVVAPAPATLATAVIDLGAADAGSVVTEKAGGAAITDTTSLKTQRLAGGTWTYDANGGVAGDGGDLLILSLVGAETVALKRKTVSGDDAGLWFGPRSLVVAGTASFDAGGSGGGAAATAEYLTGTVKAAAEKVRKTP